MQCLTRFSKRLRIKCLSLLIVLVGLIAVASAWEPPGDNLPIQTSPLLSPSNLRDGGGGTEPEPEPMAIALSAAGVHNSHDGTAATIQVTLNGVQAGDLIVVFGSYWDAAGVIPTMSVSDGNAYSSAGARFTYASGSKGSLQLFFYANATAGNKTITLTFTGDAPDWQEVAACSFSGVATSSPQDATAQVSAAANSTNPNSGNWTNDNANDVLIGFVVADAGNFDSAAGWGDAYNNGYFALCYQIVSTVAARAASGTASSNYWGAGIVGFKAAGGEPPAPVSDGPGSSIYTARVQHHIRHFIPEEIDED